MEAIDLCISRFDAETKTSFLELYTKVDADVDPNEINKGNDGDDGVADADDAAEAADNDCPF